MQQRPASKPTKAAGAAPAEGEPESQETEAKLSPRQQKFVDEYMLDLNATQAAIRAGYAAKDADVQGPRLLGNVGISAVVEKRKAERSSAAGITEERLMRELNALAFSDVSHYQQNPLTGVLELTPGAPPNAMAAVSSVEYKTRTIGGADGEPVVLEREVKFKLWDKPGSVKLAGRYRNIRGFFEKFEVTGADGGPIAIKAVRSSGEKRTRAAQLLDLARQRAGGAGKPDASGSD